MNRYRREISVALAILALSIVLGLGAPGYFSGENLNDLFLANMPVLVVALGVTLVVLTGEIDISVGSMFAVCSVAFGGRMLSFGAPAKKAMQEADAEAESTGEPTSGEPAFERGS